MTLVIVLLVVLLALMLLGWRARKRRQSAIAAPLGVPTDPGATVGEFDVLYVASTVGGEPLNRIAVRGLGFRSRATVTVTASGVILDLRGETPVFIPAADLREVTRATWTIDRVVEEGGLVLLAWNLGSTAAPGSPASATPSPTPTAVDSYLRLAQSQELIDALISILPISTGRKA